MTQTFYTKDTILIKSEIVATDSDFTKRWQPPVEYQLGFDHALANLESYDACPQDHAGQSEDCLFLDIYKELSYFES